MSNESEPVAADTGEAQAEDLKIKVSAAVDRLVRELTARHRFATIAETDEVLVYTERGVYARNAEWIVRTLVENTFRPSGRTATHHVANEVLDGIRRRTYAKQDTFNPPGKLCLLNGIFDLATLSLEPHSPDVLFISQIPVAYDPAALCPRWDQFMIEILPKAEPRQGMQMAWGYTLEPHNRLQRAFMLYGPTTTGKSTLLRVLQALLGKDNFSAITLQAMSENRFAGAQLWGKMANICADLPEQLVQWTGQFKMLTGEDPVYVEEKFKRGFSFIWPGKTWFSCNKLPRVEDNTEAFFRRWFLFALSISFVGREDRTLGSKLVAELPGIFNWAVEGLKMLRAAGGFPKSTTADKLRETWRKKSDPLRWFVVDACEVEPRLYVVKDEFFENLDDFCQTRSLRTPTREQVGEHLREVAPSVRDGRGPRPLRPRIWNGIRVKPKADWGEVEEIEGPF